MALCTLPWLGFVPDRVSSAPPVAVARLADQLGVDPDELRSYGRRAKTRTEHLRLVAKYLGWRLPTTMDLKELDEFLLARSLEHDSPTLLFRLACEYLISARVIRPGPVTVVERVAHARAEAQRETFDRLAREFTDARCPSKRWNGSNKPSTKPGACCGIPWSQGPHPPVPGIRNATSRSVAASWVSWTPADNVLSWKLGPGTHG